jgi:phosphatidylglycerol:prolipoprotein diacylglycerol transferase
VLFFSLVGSRAFYVIHYWDQFENNLGEIINFRSGGFEVYGGIIGAFVACYIYLHLKRLSLRIYADLAIPSVLLGMGIGRIGCFLFGCCWGGPCPAEMPWAVQFPFASPPHVRQWEHREVTVPAELILVDQAGDASPFPREIFSVSELKLKQRIGQMQDQLAKAEREGDTDQAESLRSQLATVESSINLVLGHYERFGTDAAQLEAMAAQPHYHSNAIHPAQLYAAIGPILLSFLTLAYFHRRERHGTVMVLGFGLYAVQRFIEEVIRSDNPQDTFGLTISQGISLAIVGICIVMYFVLKQMPLKSTRRAACDPKILARTPGYAKTSTESSADSSDSGGTGGNPQPA